MIPLADETFSRNVGRYPKVINTHLEPISEQLQLPFKICTKICRKTAAVVYHQAGYTKHGIQKIMGHQSLTMTEKHYLSTQGFVVDEEMSKVRQSHAIYTQPFLHIYMNLLHLTRDFF